MRVIHFSALWKITSKAICVRMLSGISPLSILDTVAWVTPSWSASCACVQPRDSRFSRISFTANPLFLSSNPLKPGKLPVFLASSINENNFSVAVNHSPLILSLENILWSFFSSTGPPSKVANISKAHGDDVSMFARRFSG